MPEPSSFEVDQNRIYAGYLLKWTNMLKGFQNRWFVLKECDLYYYVNPNSISMGCRGSINLNSAHLEIMDHNNEFRLTSPNGTVYQLRARNASDLAAWVLTIKTAIKRSPPVTESALNHLSESAEIIGEQAPARPSTRPKLTSAIRPSNLVSHIKNMTRRNTIAESFSNDKYKKNGDIFADADTKTLSIEHEALNAHVNDVVTVLKKVGENNVINAGQMKSLLDSCDKLIATSNVILTYQNMILDNVRRHYNILQRENEVLMKQVTKPDHSPTTMPAVTANSQDPSAAVIPLNQRQDSYVNANTNPTHSPSSSQEYFDACSDYSDIAHMNDFYEHTPISDESTIMGQGDNTRSSITNDNNNSLIINGDFGLMSNKDVVNVAKEATGASTNSPRECAANNRPLSRSMSSDVLRVDHAVAHRKTIPDKPKNSKINLFALIKSAVGKDLTKIPMPVQFNEPLSMLQRAAECMENYQLLDRAASIDDTTQQMCYVVGFTVSAFSSTAIRTTKPFNPLLNETFEMDRMTDLGWRLISEQVCHHPPISAMHVSGKNWVFEETSAVSAKFRGKYMSVSPKGMNELIIHPNNKNKHKTQVYSWKKVESCVNNIVIGTLNIECYGEMEIKNHTTGDICKMKYHTPGLLSGKGNLNRITGAVYAAGDLTTPVYVIHGYWDKIVEVGKVQSLKSSNFSLDGSNFLSSVLLEGPMQTLWKVPLYRLVANLRPETYYFSEFTCCLNEPINGCPPTDCRYRTDQRSMENGDYDSANKYKSILEDKQRERRKLAIKLNKSNRSSMEDVQRTNTDEEMDFAAKKYSHPEAIQPNWFKVDPETSVKYNCQAPFYRYKGNYWERRVKQDWAGLPTDLFTVEDTV